MKPPLTGRSSGTAELLQSAQFEALAKKRDLLRAAMRVRAAIYERQTADDDQKYDIAWIKAIRNCAAFTTLVCQ